MKNTSTEVTVKWLQEFKATHEEHQHPTLSQLLWMLLPQQETLL
jgi:hypothetical protein